MVIWPLSTIFLGVKITSSLIEIKKYNFRINLNVGYSEIGENNCLHKYFVFYYVSVHKNAAIVINNYYS